MALQMFNFLSHYGAKQTLNGKMLIYALCILDLNTSPFASTKCIDYKLKITLTQLPTEFGVM